MTYLSQTFNQDLWAYRYIRQHIHIPFINTCTIMIDIFDVGRTGVSVNGQYYLEPQKYHPLHHHKDTRNSTPLPYLDEDGGTTVTHWLLWCFMLTYAFYWWMGQRIHHTLIVLRSIPVSQGGSNNSRLGGDPSRIVLSPICCRCRSITSRCTGFS